MLVESWGIDSEPFDMLICLLTALIAPSSQRRLQREDAFQKDECRGERRRGEQKCLSIFSTSMPHMALMPSDSRASSSVQTERTLAGKSFTYCPISTFKFAQLQR